MSDEELSDAPLTPRFAATFSGLWRYLKGRLGRPVPPQYDPTKMPVAFQPLFRVVVWQGDPADHLSADDCAVLLCSVPGEYGEHSEVRPNGFTWEGAYFPSMFEAMENQAFRQWYDDGGQEIVERGDLILHDPLYQDNEQPTLPRFNFFLHENIEKMTTAEVLAYRRRGDIPKRLRRRGRNRNEPSPDALEGVEGGTPDDQQD